MAESEKRNLEHVRMLLRRWARVDAECAEYMKDLRLARDRVEDARNLRTTSASDGQPRGGLPGDPTAKAVEHLMGVEAAFLRMAEETEREMQDLQRLKQAIDEQLFEMLPDQRDVIRMKYKEGRSAVYISMQLHCSERTVYNFEEQALEKIAVRCSFYVLH